MSLVFQTGQVYWVLLQNLYVRIKCSKCICTCTIVQWLQEKAVFLEKDCISKIVNWHNIYTYRTYVHTYVHTYMPTSSDIAYQILREKYHTGNKSMHEAATNPCMIWFVIVIEDTDAHWCCRSSAIHVPISQCCCLTIDKARNEQHACHLFINHPTEHMRNLEHTTIFLTWISAYQNTCKAVDSRLFVPQPRHACQSSGLRLVRWEEPWLLSSE